MASAGYGNHETTDPKLADKPSAGAAADKPGAGSTDRPGMDLGGANDRSGPGGPGAGIRSVPDSGGTGPHSGRTDTSSPTISEGADDVSTPGAGMLPDAPNGGDVDPGAG